MGPMKLKRLVVEHTGAVAWTFVVMFDDPEWAHAVQFEEPCEAKGIVQGLRVLANAIEAKEKK